MNNHDKVLPDPKKYPILPPDMDYIYFENHRAYPFEAEKKDFSLNNAWWLGECSFLVYNHPGFARMAFELAGFDGFRFFQGKGTECMVSFNDTAVIVSFRGTEIKSLSALHEIRTDLNTMPVPFEGGGKVHKGFFLGLEEVWGGEDGLDVFLHSLIQESPERPLWITGHSLGGALATLCMARIPEATGLYIYGSPKVGDQEFIDLLAGRPFFRVEHARDPIPMVPPDVPSLHFSFKDPGQLVFIDKAGSILPVRKQMTAEEHLMIIEGSLEGQKKRRRDFALSVKKAPLTLEASKKILVEMNDHVNKSIRDWKGYLNTLNDDISLKVEDHMPIYYCIKLWNALISP